MKKISRWFLFITIAIYSFNTLVYADAVTGKIERISTDNKGRTEVILSSPSGKRTFLLDSRTPVEETIPAKNVKNGARIHLVPSANTSSGGGRKGFHSPFNGIPKGMRKKMGLPEIPSTPDIPGKPDLPEIPKLPKVPKVKEQKEGEESAAANQTVGQGKKKVQPMEQELTDEEKSLFGKADSAKSVVKPGTFPDQDFAPRARKVLSVQATEKGISLELEGSLGKTEKVLLSPNKSVVRELSAQELQKNMSIRVDMEETGDQPVVQKIKVIGY